MKTRLTKKEKQELREKVEMIEISKSWRKDDEIGQRTRLNYITRVRELKLKELGI